jgi:hypothetical protein
MHGINNIKLLPTVAFWHSYLVHKQRLDALKQLHLQNKSAGAAI